MTIHHQDATVTLHHGDCIDVLATLPDASVDAVVTDPPYGLEFMGREWDAPWKSSGAVIKDPATERGGFQDGNGGNPYSRSRVEYGRGNKGESAAFGEWCELWTAECLRVLKPGGHLLAFGGTRTWHRLASAIEDAGFEVRDSIAWLYGSGFPKSLDVSKAIDKAAGAERPVVGINPRAAQQTAKADVTSLGAFPGTSADLTAPATDAAREWEGWGTALKPAFEPVVVARKPLAGTVNIRARVEHELRRAGVEGDIRWISEPVSDAASSALPPSSSTTRQRAAAAISAAHVDECEMPSDVRPTDSASEKRPKSGATPTASTSATTDAGRIASSETPCSTPTADTAPAAASSSNSSSPSTTSTEAAPLTGKQSTARSMHSSAARATRPDTESFAGIATGLIGSLAHVHIRTTPAGEFVWPVGLPETVTGGPTVAANVLAHGTGALNIDGCRIDGGERPPIISKSEDSTGILGNGLNGSSHGGSTTSGRWPANVILDESQAAALDEQSGERPGMARGTLNRGSTTGRSIGGDSAYGSAEPQSAEAGYGDTGGASRFFYVAKAPGHERPRVGGTAHPTVKPLDLMRWLVRLVTPPGGTVLEPFAGSGTTVEACILEGFHCIAIEKTDEYLPLVMARIHRRRNPVEAIKLAGDDLGLFDLFTEEPTA